MQIHILKYKFSLDFMICVNNTINYTKIIFDVEKMNVKMQNLHYNLRNKFLHWNSLYYKVLNCKIIEIEWLKVIFCIFYKEGIELSSLEEIYQIIFSRISLNKSYLIPCCFNYFCSSRFWSFRISTNHMDCSPSLGYSNSYTFSNTTICTC